MFYLIAEQNLQMMRQIKGKNQHKVSQYGVKPAPASSDDQHSSTRY